MSTRIVIQAMEGFTVNQGIVAVFELSMVVIAFLLLKAAMRRAKELINQYISKYSLCSQSVT